MPDYTIVIARLEKLKADLPKIAGAAMVEHATDNLRADGFDGVLWSPPAPNGLILTGRGIRSLTFKTNADKVKLQAEPYMVAHNEGARIQSTHTVRSHTRRGRQVRSHSRTVNFKMPKRKFSGQSNRLNRIYGQAVAARLKKAFS